MKKNSKKIVTIGTLALVAAMFISCPKPVDTPVIEEGEHPAWLKKIAAYPDVSENEVGVISKNLVQDGDADGTAAGASPALLMGGETGVESAVVDGGVNGTKCYQQRQTGSGEWQETNFKLTPIYGQGKSYLISFKYKADPAAEAENFKSKDENLFVSYSAYSGDVQMACMKHGVENWAFDDKWGEKSVWGTDLIGPWGLSFSSDDYLVECLKEQLDPDFAVSEPTTLSDDWKECNVIIDAETIASALNNTGMYSFGLSIYMGASGEGGYSFLLDDIVILDLNYELEQMDVTWKDPNVTEEDEEGGEEGGEEAAE